MFKETKQCWIAQCLLFLGGTNLRGTNLLFSANKAELDKKMQYQKLHFTFKEIVTKRGQLPFQVLYTIFCVTENKIF